MIIVVTLILAVVPNPAQATRPATLVATRLTAAKYRFLVCPPGTTVNVAGGNCANGSAYVSPTASRGFTQSSTFVFTPPEAGTYSAYAEAQVYEPDSVTVTNTYTATLAVNVENGPPAERR